MLGQGGGIWPQGCLCLPSGKLGLPPVIDWWYCNVRVQTSPLTWTVIVWILLVWLFFHGLISGKHSSYLLSHCTSLFSCKLPVHFVRFSLPSWPTICCTLPSHPPVYWHEAKGTSSHNILQASGGVHLGFCCSLGIMVGSHFDRKDMTCIPWECSIPNMDLNWTCCQ